MRRYGWLAVVLVAAACSGNGPELPGWLFEEDTVGTTAVETTVVETAAETMAAETTVAETTVAETTAGPTAECGNGDLEDGEECDGADFGLATCESLGLSGAGLACVGCQLDVSGCGPPPEMVEVPGGVFEMGADYPNEQPIRQVQVDTFWMDETEVTVAAYAACVDDTVCGEPTAPAGENCNWMVAGREDHPVNCVTWAEANAYCDWAGGGTKRLPTEAEWEKAARGTDARLYPWGDSPAPDCERVVMDDAAAEGDGCGMSSTWPVESKVDGASYYGAYDMAGNVYEWVTDWFATSYDAAQTDNPTGPDKGTMHVLRGGSWGVSNAVFLRAASRISHDPAHVGNDVGFRCARTPPAPL